MSAMNPADDGVTGRDCWRTGWACLACRARMELGQPRCHLCGCPVAISLSIPAVTPAGRSEEKTR